MDTRLNEIMATKIMGYERGANSWLVKGLFTAPISFQDWHPDTDLTQAITCVRKLCKDNNYKWYLGEVDNGDYKDSKIACCIFGWAKGTPPSKREDGFWYRIWREYDKNPSLAVCKAIIKVMENK